MLDIMDMKLLHACYFVQWCTFSVLPVEQCRQKSQLANSISWLSMLMVLQWSKETKLYL